jgi:hypothetical protein
MICGMSDGNRNVFEGAFTTITPVRRFRTPELDRPLLPFYSQRLGATPWVIGPLVHLYAVCPLVAGPVVGMPSDRYGRRNVPLVSQIGTLVGLVLLASSLTLVFLARMIDGLTLGNISVAHANAVEHSAPSTRKQVAVADVFDDVTAIASGQNARPYQQPEISGLAPELPAPGAAMDAR